MAEQKPQVQASRKNEQPAAALAAGSTQTPPSGPSMPSAAALFGMGAFLGCLGLGLYSWMRRGKMATA